MRQFEEGKTYHGSFIGDSDVTFSFLVTRRTSKTVVVENCVTGETSRRRIRIWNGVEKVDPFGSFSMSPSLRADREVVAA